MVADTPRLVAEVLSPTTRDFDTFGKLDEYKRIGSLQWILLIEPNAPEVTAWSRDGSKQWVKKVFENLAEEISMPELGIELSLNAIYEGVSFPLTPRLVPDGHRTSDENEAG
jgi:Uma2 family endonuclease